MSVMVTVSGLPLAVSSRKSQAEQIGAEINIVGQLEVPSIGIPLDQRLALRAQQLASFDERQPREAILERQLIARADPWGGCLHDWRLLN